MTTPLTFSCKIVVGLTSGIGVALGGAAITYMYGSRPSGVALAAGTVIAAGASYGGYSKSESICKDVTPETFSVPLDLEAYSNDPTMTPTHLKSLV
jgi:hypothetical protein